MAHSTAQQSMSTGLAVPYEETASAGTFQASVCAIVAKEEVGLPSGKQSMVSPEATSGSADSPFQQCFDAQDTLKESQQLVRCVPGSP